MSNLNTEINSTIARLKALLDNFNNTNKGIDFYSLYIKKRLQEKPN